MSGDRRGDPGRVLDLLTRRGWSLGAAESLTGGQLAAMLVTVPGASRVFAGAIVAYAPEVKIRLLGVDPRLIDEVGTVDEQVACQMALGVRSALDVDVGVATTGVAGPGPSEGHPAGTVWLACATPQGVKARRMTFTGERPDVRASAVSAALALTGEVLLSADGGAGYGSS